MDPIIAKLNEIAQGTVSKSVKLPEAPQNKSVFQNTLDNSMAERLLDKMKEDYGMNSKNEMKVVSAESIHVETATSELATKPFSANDKFYDTFKELNKDLIGLDSAIETLTTPGLKVSPQQLLALQAGVANTTILAEGFTRFVDAAAKTIQNLTTQVNV